MSDKQEAQLSGTMAVGRGAFSPEVPMPSPGAKTKARRHERRKVKELLHLVLLEDEEEGFE